MSRTYKTDPLKIQGYREQRRAVDPDWRTRWHFRNSPPYWDVAGRDAFYREFPWPPSWKVSETHNRSTKKDRRFLHKRVRASVRQAIAHGDLDLIEPYVNIWWD